MGCSLFGTGCIFDGSFIVPGGGTNRDRGLALSCFSPLPLMFEKYLHYIDSYFQGSTHLCSDEFEFLHRGMRLEEGLRSLWHVTTGLLRRPRSTTWASQGGSALLQPMQGHSTHIFHFRVLRARPWRRFLSLTCVLPPSMQVLFKTLRFQHTAQVK